MTVVEQAWTIQLARMESTVLGLDGRAARLAEVIALRRSSDAGGTTGTRRVELNSDLDGLRAGPAEAEELSRNALAASTPGRAGGSGVVR